MMIWASFENERGQSLILLIFLVTILMGALAALQLSVFKVRNSLITNRVEDDAARILAEAGAEEARGLIRGLSDLLDTNGDGTINSSDDPHTAQNVSIEGGSYDYAITGNFKANHELCFKTLGPLWNVLKLEVLEDGVVIAERVVERAENEPFKFDIDWDTEKHN